MALTEKAVAKLREPGRHGDGHGLYLQVTRAGSKSWLLRFERGGRERWMGLGPTHTIGLKEARERARKARQLLLDGLDPLDARAQQRATQALAAARALTFEQAARQYFDQHERKWKNAKHRAQFLATLRDYVFPKIGRLPVASIDTGLVLKLSSRFGTKRPKLRIECVGGLKVCSIGQPCEAIGPAIIQRVGAGI